MMNTIESNIEQYISFYRNQVNSIAASCQKTPDGGLHSRILYMAILDAITRPVFLEESNRERIIQFVSTFCDWPECNHISLPHLYRLVKTKTEPQFASLRNFAIRCHTQWLPDSLIYLDRDPEFNEVASLWPTDGENHIKIDNVNIIHLKHSNLLYTYRNYLFHEYKTPGQKVEFWNSDRPYYGYLTETKDEIPYVRVNTWELQYTAGFFRKLCNSGLSNLEKHLKTNMLDPLKSKEEGNYWIGELNRN